MSFIELFDQTFWIMTFKIIVAVVLCGLIGLEREINNHSAGFRTHILVGVGSSLMMILSLYGFESYINGNGNIQFDPARIPSYVISGIGFLGAGTIMVSGMNIKGLTTAASIWTVAGIGLVVGAGMYPIAILTTFVVLISLVLLSRVEKLIRRKKKNRLYKLILGEGAQVGEILNLFEQNMIIVRKMEVENGVNDKRVLYIEIEEADKTDRLQISSELSKMDGVICETQK